MFMFYSHSCAEEAQLTPLLRLGAGACAGIIAMSATYPMDMVRGRLTVQVLLKENSFGIFNLFGFASRCIVNGKWWRTLLKCFVGGKFNLFSIFL